MRESCAEMPLIVELPDKEEKNDEQMSEQVDVQVVDDPVRDLSDKEPLQKVADTVSEAMDLNECGDKVSACSVNLAS